MSNNVFTFDWSLSASKMESCADDVYGSSEEILITKSSAIGKSEHLFSNDRVKLKNSAIKCKCWEQGQ